MHLYDARQLLRNYDVICL